MRLALGVRWLFATFVGGALAGCARAPETLTRGSASSAPPRVPARDAGPLDTSVGCAAPFATPGQRWSERLTLSRTQRGAPASSRQSARDEPVDERLTIEVLAASAGVPTEILRTFGTPGAGRSARLVASTESGVERFVDGFSVGPRAWPATAFARAVLEAGPPPPLDREKLGAALGHRLVSALGEPSLDHVHVELAPPADETLPWGSALALGVSIEGTTGGAPSGRATPESFTLSGVLLVRAGDGAFVSLSVQGPTTLGGTLAIRLERPCFATPLTGPPR